MNIAVFTDSFLPGTGGTENAILNMSKSLINLGHNVKIYCPSFKNNESGGMNTFRVPSLKLTKNDVLALPNRCKKKIIDDVKNFNADIIHFCTASSMAQIALIVGKELNIPVVSTIHTKFKDAFYCGTKSKLITNILIKKLAKRLNSTVSVSTVSFDMREELKKYGYTGEAIIIRNGALQIFEGKLEENKTDKFIFLYCGQLIKAKNVQFSLKCLANIKKEHNFNNFKFVIIGAGVYRKNLEKLVKKYNLVENVEFTGLITDKNYRDSLYRTSNLLLFPSTFDNDSLVIVEASRNHLPTLSLKGYGCGERIENNKTGFLANYTEKDYTNRIWEILNNPKLYADVKKNVHNMPALSWDEIGLQYEKFYLTAIETYKKN